MGLAVANKGGANRDGKVGVAGKVEVADHAAEDTAVGRLELVDNLEGAWLRRARQRAGRKSRLEHIDETLVFANMPLDRRNKVHDVAEAVNRHELANRDRVRFANLEQVVAREVDQHQVLGALLGVSEQILGRCLVGIHTLAARARAGDWVHDGLAIRDLH